jgi:hypothetical protein
MHEQTADAAAITALVDARRVVGDRRISLAGLARRHHGLEPLCEKLLQRVRARLVVHALDSGLAAEALDHFLTIDLHVILLAASDPLFRKML